MSWASGWWSTWPGSCCWSVGCQAMRCSTCPQCRELCCKNTYFFGCCFFPLLLDSCSAGVLCPKVACIPSAKQVKGRRVVCRCALWKVLDSPWYEVRTHPMSMYASFSGLVKSVLRCPDKGSFSQSPYATTPLPHCSFAKVRTDLRDIWPVPFSEVVLVTPDSWHRLGRASWDVCSRREVGLGRDVVLRLLQSAGAPNLGWWLGE